ncbi:DHS-like NAD/FAD-binding domain-containing protein, partial [Atractiella rhizophila]
NPAHYVLSYLLHTRHLSALITQNVDSLHHRSLPTSSPSHSSIIELHGTLADIHCTSEQCRTVYKRSWFTSEVERLNPMWVALAAEIREKGEKIRLNPDGDVDLGPINYNSFNVPPCPSCGTGILKPSLIFFGESLPQSVRDAAHNSISSSSHLLVIGTSLATYSSYRLFRQALDEGKKVGILNVGETRADREVGEGKAWKVEEGATEVLREVGRLLGKENGKAAELLRMGTVRKVKGAGYAS